MSHPDPNHPPPAPDPLAVALAKLDPAPHGFDWNALMFAAGRESKARALLFWRVATGVCALVACGLAVALFLRPVPAVVVERPVYVERIVPAPAPPVAPAVEAPAPRPVPEPGGAPAPVTEPPAQWSYDPPPSQGAAARWFHLRNDVLTVGLGVLPDTGPKMSNPSNEK